MKQFGAQSEILPLRRVLMHRPGDEIDLVTEENKDAYGFLGVMDREILYRDFDHIVEMLTGDGVDVVLLTDILKDDQEALDYIVRRPNMTYVRDLATVFDAGAILWSMSMRSRRWDNKIIRKAFDRLGVPILGELKNPELLEGGGVTFLSPDICAAGLCSRATEGAFLYLADLLLGKHLKELVMVPTTAGVIHIDGEFLMVDDKLAYMYMESINTHPSTVYTLKGSSIKSRQIWFADYLNELGFDLIEMTREEQENGAANFIQTGPRRVIGFDWAKRLGGELEKRGGKVQYFDGEQIFRGHAGIHCMTCPVLRSE